MTRTAEQVIDATRFLTEEGRIECFCCGGVAFESSGFCGTCHVPLDITRSAQARGTQPYFIPVLGASGAGKTVYIGLLLDILSKGVEGIRGLPANALSVAIQQRTLAALQRRRFPEKTVCEAEQWQWVHCEVGTPKQGPQPFVDIVTPDLAGESVAMELDHPGSFPAVRTCVANAAAIIVLVDAVRARDCGTDEDMFATKLVTYIHQHIRRTGVARKKVKIPLAVTFTKSDLCPEAEEDPNAFAGHNLPSLVAYTERYYSKIRFFTASAVGSVANVIDGDSILPVPLHVQPNGIAAPLTWVIQA